MVQMKKLKINVIAGDNPNRFEVKVKTLRGLSVFEVKAKNAKQAVERYSDSAFSKCTMSFKYSF